MNINPDMVSSLLPTRLAAEGDPSRECKPGMACPSPRVSAEVPIIITSHAPDREQSYSSMGGGAEPSSPLLYSTASPQQLAHITFPSPGAYVVRPAGAYYSPVPTAAELPQIQPTLPYETPRGLTGTMPPAYVQQTYGGYISPQREERESPASARQGPLTQSMYKFVADNVAEACLTVRPPAGDEDPSNKTDDVTKGAAALTPAANTTNGGEFKKEGHRSGGLHIPNFLRGRRSRRNSMSSPTQMESSDTLSSGSNSGDDLSDVEFDEELDNKLKEEVEKDLPPSITDLTKAERTNVRKIYLLYNPMSGNKRGKRVAAKALRLIEREGVTVEMVRLTDRGHAEQLCETMDLDGYDVVVGVGGDGTFHECINGMMKRSLDQGKRLVPLALIAAGTGNSFMHELRCYKLKSAIYHILRGVNYPIDICRLTFGDGSSCYSFNSIHWGIASKIMLTAEKLRWMGHAMRYTTACFMEIIGGEKARLAKIMVTDENDKEVEYNDKFIVAIANNIITASKGMKMAPQAKIDDGLIDLLLIKATSTLNLLDIFRRTYDGSHTELPYVIYQKVKKFTITPYTESDTGELEEVEEILDVDGELKGSTPFTCEVLPQVLRIVL